MPRMQTLSEFMAKPFNNPLSMTIDRDTKYSNMYDKFVRENRIYLKAVCNVEDSWYYHVKIPSESNKGKIEYDVVIRFFTNNPRIANEDQLKNYYIQFFSNSPSFIYTYAYLYNSKGYLVDLMYNKTDKEYINTPPTKTNPDGNMLYDKSIYFACKFLASSKYYYLNKNTVGKAKRVTPEVFFNSVSDFKTVKAVQDIINAEKTLKKEADKKRQNRAIKDANKTKGIKILPGMSLSKGAKGIKIVSPKGKISPKAKVRSTKSTKR